MRSLTIQIPQPCHERWADMEPTEQGRFCASCQETVVDYTAFSDQELVRLLSRSSETACGRFRNEQLNRPLPLSNSGLTSVWRHWVGLLSMSLFGWQTALAQQNQTSSPPQTTSVRPDYAVTTLPIRAPLGGSVTQLTIAGKVMLMDSSGRLSPVPRANISVRRPGGNWYIQTDSTGAFNLSVSIQMQATEMEVWVYAPGAARGHITFPVTPKTTSIVLDDIVLNEAGHLKYITGGGLTLIKTPSRWQKFKRKLFH